MKDQLKFTGIISLLLFPTFRFFGFTTTTKKEPQRPNILYIMADDHTSQAWGIYGGILKDYIHAPNISRLAEEGCVLNNCLVSNSISVPSRATIMTGQYSHVNGVKTLGGSLSPAVDNIAKEMHKGGYQTAIIGKWHLNAEPSGFDYYCVLPGQGDYRNPTMISKGDWKDDHSGAKVHKGFSTDIIADMTISWLKNRDKTKPFLMMCHFKATHEPFDYPERHKDLYKDLDIPAPFSILDHGPATNQRTFKGNSMDNLKQNYLTASAHPEKIKDYMKYPDLPFSVDGLSNDEARMKTYKKFIKDYLRCGAGIDDNIGKLLNYLDKAGLSKNTVVIYTSDQGYFLGEHGWFDKRTIYEESIRMPFVIRYPKEIPAGTRNNDIIMNVDFPALFADYGGIKYPAQGHSFRQNLEGNTPANWRKYGYYRYWQHLNNLPAHFGIRGEQYKLAFYYGNGLKENGNNKDGNAQFWEFFNLKIDPHETHNAYHEPGYQDIIEKLKKELLQQREMLGDTDQDNPEILEIIAQHWNDRNTP